MLRATAYGSAAFDLRLVGQEHHDRARERVTEVSGDHRYMCFDPSNAAEAEIPLQITVDRHFGVRIAPQHEPKRERAPARPP